MLLEDRASVEAVLDERDPSKLRIDIRVHPAGGGSSGSDAVEIQRAIREGFREALREVQLERLVLGTNRQPKRRGWLASVLGFILCVGLGSAATFVLTTHHPQPNSVAGLDDPGRLLATPGSQSSSVAEPPEVIPPQSSASASAARSEPGPGVFGLHQQ